MIESHFDAFLSHGSPDKAWVQTLHDELAKRGLTAYLDVRELKPGDNFVISLDEGLQRSRFLILVLSTHTEGRQWVEWEWSTHMADRGPLGRIIPILLDDVPLPHALLTSQAIRATHRDASRVADELADRIGRPEQMATGDSRRRYLGQHLPFVVALSGEQVTVRGLDGQVRLMGDPRCDHEFAAALQVFRRLVRVPALEDGDRADLFRAATYLGQTLFAILFDDPAKGQLHKALVPGGRPLVTLCAEEELLTLPWELLHDGETFLLRDGVIDLVRTTLNEVDSRALLREPVEPFNLVLNVSAPAHSGLRYEEESYRLTLVLTEHCPPAPTELGTVDDLVRTIRREQPTGVHFSGHGGPGKLLFENDFGENDEVPIASLVERLKRECPEGRLPPFFYLACCHGNDVAEGAESAAARLHREGVAQVVGYSGPIRDDLSTAAEVSLYAALARGESTRQAVRDARNALLRKPGETSGLMRGASGASGASSPFAWSQLVIYHRGPDFPLGTPTAGGGRAEDGALRRTFHDPERKRVLKTGFIGRRREMHAVRDRLLRKNWRVLVLQGLGGLGKSTLSLHLPPLLGQPLTCVLWCGDAEKQDDPIAALGKQLSAFAGNLFKQGWDEVVREADPHEPLDRFTIYLDTLLANVPRLILILDNLESLLVGPAETAKERPDPRALGAWRSEVLCTLWKRLRDRAENGDKLWVIASSRYQNPDFANRVLPVTPLPRDALFRLTNWFDALQRLSFVTQARLAEKLDGHPRAVQYANALVACRLEEYEQFEGEWRMPPEPTRADLEREWQTLVEPVLPDVQSELWADLLLEAIWDRVLDHPMRRMLYRMTLLRIPWTWKLVGQLGELGEPDSAAADRARALRRTSLLEQTEQANPPHFTLHPATVAYVQSRFGKDEPLRIETHRRVGEWFLEEKKQVPLLEHVLEGGHHLFEAGNYDTSCDLITDASTWMRHHGRVRESLAILLPFLDEEIQKQINRRLLGQLVGVIGLSWAALGQMTRALAMYERRLQIAREIDDRRGEGNALGNMGNVYSSIGQPRKAIECFEAVLGIADELNDKLFMSNVLGNLGNAYAELNEIERAIEFHERALAISREIGNKRSEGQDLANLGAAYSALKQPERSIEYTRQAMAISREIGDRQGEATALGNLGTAFRNLGQVQRAIECYQEQLRIARELGTQQSEANASWNLGLILASQQKLKEAIALMEFTVAYFTQVGHPEATRTSGFVQTLRERLSGSE